MNEKNIGKRIILATFMIVICLSWLLWILLAKFVDTENYENRVLATKPELTVDSYKTYPSEYEKYFNDNMPFRNNLVTMNTAIDYFIFSKSTSGRVVVGKDDWLFYADRGDGNPISCYQGTNLLSEEKLEAMAQNCLAVQAYLDELGKEFIIFIAPNKERIYYNKMPEKYGTPADTYKALQIVEYLRNNTNIRVVYPYDELMQAKESLAENIYYKTDTHWNLIGGYVGAAALMRELDVEMPDITSNEITITEGSNTAGDLAGMLNLKKYLAYADHGYTVEGYSTQNADPRKIYVKGDSFRAAMISYIESQFINVYQSATCTYEELAEQNPDIFIYETVERYVDGLASFSIQ